MNPKSSLDRMQAALDGELSPEARAQFEKLLADSPEAQAGWEALVEVEQLFRAAPMATPRPGFSRRFKARLTQRRSPPGVWGMLMFGGAAVGLGLATLLVAGNLLSILLFAPASSSWLLSLTTEIALRLADVEAILGALTTSVSLLGRWALIQPLTWLFVLSGFTLTLVWLYLVRKLTLLEVSIR